MKVKVILMAQAPGSIVFVFLQKMVNFVILVVMRGAALDHI